MEGALDAPPPTIVAYEGMMQITTMVGLVTMVVATRAVIVVTNMLSVGFSGALQLLGSHLQGSQTRLHHIDSR